MSFSDKPTVSAVGKVGCLAYMVVGTLIVIFCLLMAAMGHNECSYEPELSGCEWDGLRRLIWFPGSLILVIGGGVLFARLIMKDEE